MPSLKRRSGSIVRRRPRKAPEAGRAALARRPHAEWAVRLRSARQTRRMGAALGAALRGGEVLALTGELGTGKTTFVRGLAEGLGIPSTRVTSPSFVVIQPHRGRLRLAHADLYRLEGAHQLRDLELQDYYADGASVVAVEWADRADGELPGDRLEIAFRHVSPTTREARFVARGPQARRLLASLARANGRPDAGPRRLRRKR